MKEIKLISVCETDCSSTSYKTVVDEKGRSNKVVAFDKNTKSGWGQYVEITTLPNGKKVSVTKHGPIPKK